MEKSIEEISFFHSELLKIKNAIQHKISVMGDDEIEPHNARLLVLFEDFFEKSSKEYNDLNRIVEPGFPNPQLVTLLVTIITRLELRLKKIEAQAARAISSSDVSRIKIGVDPKVIHLILGELNRIKSELPKIKVLEAEKLRGVQRNIYSLLEKVFEKTHQVFDKTSIVIDKDNLISKCDLALSELNIYLMSITSDFSNLHITVIEKSEKQFNDGHYREAVNNAFVALIEVAKEKYPIYGNQNKLKDGVELMQDIFSKDQPKLQVSNDANERQGMMFLYVGAVQAIRNKYSHKTNKINDKNYALDLLHFASALFRILDDPSIY